jgi:SH3 domain protein
MNALSMKKILGFSMGLSCTLFSQQLIAADRYVNDVVYVALRSDKNPESEVIQRSIVSGTKLSFIREETGTDNNMWSLVVSPEGKEGWVRSYSLTPEPTAAMKLAKLPKEVQDSAKLLAEKQLLSQQLEKLQTEHQQLLADTEDMRQAATTSLNLEEDNQKLHAEFQLIQTERDMLKAENERLKDTDRFHQWVYGGGLLLGGVVLSFMLQAFGRRKRQSEWR